MAEWSTFRVPTTLMHELEKYLLTEESKKKGLTNKTQLMTHLCRDFLRVYQDSNSSFNQFKDRFEDSNDDLKKALVKQSNEIKKLQQETKEHHEKLAIYQTVVPTMEKYKLSEKMKKIINGKPILTCYHPEIDELVESGKDFLISHNYDGSYNVNIKSIENNKTMVQSFVIKDNVPMCKAGSDEKCESLHDLYSNPKIINALRDRDIHLVTPRYDMPNTE